MMRTQHALGLLVLIGASTGCTLEGSGYATPNGQYEAAAVDAPQGEYAPGDGAVAQAGIEVDTNPAFGEPPPLVTIDSGVSVVEDASYPEYYSDGVYWSFHDGVWYRADYYDAPWVVVDGSFVPIIVSHRDHHQFEHYHHHDQDRVWHEEKAEHHRAEDQRGRDHHDQAAPRREAAQPRVENHAQPEPRREEPRREEPRREEARPAPQREVHPQAPAHVEPMRPAPARVVVPRSQPHAAPPPAKRAPVKAQPRRR